MNQLQLFDNEVKAIYSVNITLYDVSSAPLNPRLVERFIEEAEKIAHKEYGLALTVIKSEKTL